MLWPVLAENHHDGLYETLCFKSHSTLKIKGRLCVVSNENEIGMGRLFNGVTGLRYVQDTQIIMKGCEELTLYTESWRGSYLWACTKIPIRRKPDSGNRECFFVVHTVLIIMSWRFYLRKGLINAMIYLLSLMQQTPVAHIIAIDNLLKMYHIQWPSFICILSFVADVNVKVSLGVMII